MKKRKLKMKVKRLERVLPLLMQMGEALLNEVDELRKKRLTREEVADVADRVNRLLTEDK